MDSNKSNSSKHNNVDLKGKPITGLNTVIGNIKAKASRVVNS
jgi:hypothetical protein